MLVNTYQNCKICNGSIKEINKKHHISECKNCGFLFYNIKIDEEEINKIYAELYAEGGEYDRTFKASMRSIEQKKQPPLGFVRTSTIKKALAKIKGKQIAEIGASVGSVGMYLQNLGYAYQGFELHKPTVDFAFANGINMKEGGFHALQDYTNAFDCLFAFEVIEHLEDLSACIKFIEKALKPAGYFAFTVPNYAKINDNKYVEDYLYQMPPPVHINFFTKENIERFFPMYNFNVIEIRKKKFIGPTELKLKNIKRFFRLLSGTYEGPSLMVMLQKKN
ncbi:MAG: class I SAM-dependent methyltransferase [Chitinophagaceae bacterium]|jgi:2-polyprenyl-3-methyl-5-hydroxy-6-metoxy-1,4-benzoquinol methylase|nr:class I SAM-dependent methyltransferase [Chitinophagaceae bacterium]